MGGRSGPHPCPLPEGEGVRLCWPRLEAAPTMTARRQTGADGADPYGLKISAKKSFIACHERASALALYATPFEGSFPASFCVNACTAPP